MEAPTNMLPFWNADIIIQLKKEQLAKLIKDGKNIDDEAVRDIARCILDKRSELEQLCDTLNYIYGVRRDPDEYDDLVHEVAKADMDAATGGGAEVSDLDLDEGNGNDGYTMMDFMAEHNIPAPAPNQTMNGFPISRAIFDGYGTSDTSASAGNNDMLPGLVFPDGPGTFRIPTPDSDLGIRVGSPILASDDIRDMFAGMGAESEQNAADGVTHAGAASAGNADAVATNAAAVASKDHDDGMDEYLTTGVQDEGDGSELMEFGTTMFGDSAMEEKYNNL